MPNGNHENEQVAVVNLVDNPVGPHADPHRRSASEFLAPIRPRGIGESPNRVNNSQSVLAINASELFLGGAENLDTIVHVSRPSSRSRTASSKATAA